jgi:hypothetical protein
MMIQNQSQLNNNNNNNNNNNDQQAQLNLLGAKLGYKLSEEQEIIIKDSIDGRANIKIKAGAGCTKSTTCFLCAQASPDLKFLILTYNKRLQMHAEKTIQKAGISNLEVRTYHSAIGRAYGETANDNIKFIDLLKEEPKSLDILACDVLVLDEVQDMAIPYYLFVEKLVQHSKNKIKMIIVIGDDRQAINQYNGARVEFLLQCDMLPGFNNGKPWISRTLSTSYRLTPAMARFVNNHILGIRSEVVSSADKSQTKLNDYFKRVDVTIESSSTTNKSNEQKLPKSNQSQNNQFLLVGGNTRTENIKPFYHVSPFSTLAKDISVVVKNCIRKYGHENVAILAVSTKPLFQAGSHHPLAKLTREFLTEIPIFSARDNEILNEDAVRGKLTITSWASMKGCEKDAIILMGFDETYFKYYDKDWKILDELPNIMYVAATRAKRELHIFADYKETLRTFDMTRLKEDVQIISTVPAPKNLRNTNNMITNGFYDPLPPNLIFNQNSQIDTKNNLMKFGSCFSNTNITSASFINNNNNNNNNRTKEYTVKELLRHIDSELLYELNQMLDVTSGPMIHQSKADDPRDLSAHKHYKPIEISLPDNFSFFVNFGSYGENTTSLHVYAILAMVEMDKNGVLAKFASKSHLPQIVDPNAENNSNGNGSGSNNIFPNIYSLTQQAYDDFPKGFWDQVKSAYSKKPTDRLLEDWFRLAVAEIVFTENNHHTARQIKDYKWVENNAEFIKIARLAVTHCIRKNNGDFMKSVNMTMDKYHIRGTADFVDNVQDEMWQFECITNYTPDYLLELACLMILAKKTRAYLYCIMSGRIFSITLKDKDHKNKDKEKEKEKDNENINVNEVLSYEELSEKFLRLILTKFDKKEAGDILNDIDVWKKKHLTVDNSGGSSTLEKKEAIPEPIKPPSPRTANLLAKYIKMKK